MPVMREYPPGTPCWADLSTPDARASSAFYGGLFGWEVNSPAGSDAGAYAFFVPAGTPADEAPARLVAGLMPLTSEVQPAGWNTYVSVTDAAATAELVAEAGGQVLVPPMDIDGQGTMTMFADDQGARIAAWQPKAFRGAGLVNEPGCLCWNELACRDTAAAERFYGRVFGWQADTSQMGPMTTPNGSWTAARSAAWRTWTRTGPRGSHRTGWCTSRWLTATPRQPGQRNSAGRCVFRPPTSHRGGSRSSPTRPAPCSPSSS